MAALYGSTSADTVSGTSGNDTIYGWAVGGNANSPSGDDTLNGNAGNDILYGGTGNDYLYGGAGSDTLYGGSGNDRYLVDSTTVSIIEYSNEGIDTVESSVSYTLGSNLENLTLTGTSSINGTGNSLGNVITGNAGNNILDGGGGVDTLSGGAGNDTYVIDSTSEVVTEAANAGTDTVNSSVSYTLGDNLENLTLTGTGNINGTGNSLDNVITGNAGDNILSGGGGVDTFNGGAGNDIYIIDSSSDVVTEAANGGTDIVNSSASYTLGSNLENLTLTGTGDIDGTGNRLNNVIIGNAGDNILSGGGGVDTFSGGAGNDTYVIDSSSDVVTEAANGGKDIVNSSVSYTLGDNLENLTLTGTSNINGTGNSLGNVITGNAGNNILDGGGGVDTLSGGAGNDTYVIDSTSEVVIEAANAGTDTVKSSVSYTLSDNLENLTLTGTGNINGTGNSLDNVITGNAGDNILSGGAGSDTLDGGAGDDTYVIDSTTTIIEWYSNGNGGTDTVKSSVSYTLGSNLENLTLTGTGNINGTGNSLNNVIIGNAGNNILSGGGGVDTFSGGAGDDTYVIDSSSDVITEAANGGTDIVNSSVSYTLDDNLENLTLTGTSNINGTGNSLNNVITGNAGNNILDGGGGVDTLSGGAGNDTYIIDSTTTVTEATNAGTDIVKSSVSYTLGDNLENLTLTGTGNINGTGNSLNNVITGNTGDNILNGGAGYDTLNGGAGDDIYIIDSSSDVVTEAANGGTDIVKSSASYTLGSNLENLTLIGTGDIDGTGNRLNNVIIGNAGDNILSGGGGVDTFSGGAGNDTYVIDSSSDVITEAANGGTDIVNSSVSYTLDDNLENLTLTGTSNINGTGNSLNNVITGNAGNNILDGGGGVDTLSGGAGNDTYIIDSTTTVTEATNAGTDIVKSSVSYTLGDNLENLTLTGTSNINGTGNSLNNVITGNTGDNILNGGAGYDTLNGGAGDDIYIIDSSTTITEGADAGTDTVQSSAGYTLANNLENLTLTGTDDINGTGNSLDNIIIANAGNNILNGGYGNDTLIGGAGNDTLMGGKDDDTYIIDSTSDTITEYSYSGTDTVQSSISYTLSNNLENLTQIGTGNISGTGNSLDNVIIGNAGNNILTGGGGVDTLIGGAGNDTYIIDNTSDTITEAANSGVDIVQSTASFMLSSNLESLTLTGSNDIDGIGNSLNNVIIGNTGDNILDGGAGNDTLIGGAGDDTYILDNTNDTVTELTNSGIDTVQSSFTYTLGYALENLTLTGTSNINGTGNALDNTIVGNAANNALNAGDGDDTLDDGGGSDTLSGGTGDDTYLVSSTTATIIEYFGEGLDTVESVVDYALSDNLEKLILRGQSDINGIGNSSDNRIFGNDGNNYIDGSAGDDTLDSGFGDDTLDGSDGNDFLRARFGDDLLSGGIGDDTLDGGFGDDTLSGNDGNDVLEGSFGDDLLNGGIGNDTLDGSHDNDTVYGNNGNDVIDGGFGNDLLCGGYGSDTLIGGDDADTFYFSEFEPQQIDTITDFSYDEFEADKIQISAAGFGIGLGDYNRFTFNSDTGALLFNQQQFASLQLETIFNISSDLIIV